MKDYSHIFNAHPQYIDSLYAAYRRDPGSVDAGWRLFFEGFEFAHQGNGQAAPAAAPAAPMAETDAVKEFGVMSIIHGFRNRGHLLSTTNPIRIRKDRRPHLDLADYNLSEADLDQPFQAGQEIGLTNATLAEILDRLRKIYAGHIGFEYAHIENRERRMWLRDRIENRPGLADRDDFGLEIGR